MKKIIYVEDNRDTAEAVKMILKKAGYEVKIANSGKKVKIFEEHSKIGEPVQCTGIISNKFKEIIEPEPEFLINTITKTRIHSPNRRFIELKLKPNYILDRTRFDSYLADKAREAGAKINLGNKFQGYIKKKNKFTLKISHKKKTQTIEAE